MTYVLEYLSTSYLTLIMLAGLAMIQVANRRAKIEGVQYIWAIMGLVFLLTVLDYIEYWAEAYDKGIFWLYIKTSGIYCIYPLIALLELYLIVPGSRKLALTVPYVAFIGVQIADLFGAGLTYFFHDDYHFAGGTLRPLPFCMDFLYTVILAVYTLKALRPGNYFKFLIVIYMTVSTVLTAVLEVENAVTGLTEEITAFDIIVYYAYLAAVQQGETQTELHHKELELEKSRFDLLTAQIKPHFINNALIAIQECCYEDPENAADLIGHFAKYLRNSFTAANQDAPIPLTDEIQNVKEYLTLEYADPSKKFQVEYDLQCTEFRVPALGIEPLVENAVKHGIDRYSPEAKVVLRSYEETESWVVEIRDNGKGFDMNAETLGKGGIGLKNSASRLELISRGKIEISRKHPWTIIKITIPKE